MNKTKTYIPDAIYEKFFSLFNDGCTFEEAFKKSELNQYMTDKEYIENFKRDVEELRDIVKEIHTFLKENEKFLMENPDILNPLKEKLLSMQNEIEEYKEQLAYEEAYVQYCEDEYKKEIEDEKEYEYE